MYINSSLTALYPTVWSGVVRGSISSNQWYRITVGIQAGLNARTQSSALPMSPFAAVTKLLESSLHSSWASGVKNLWPGREYVLTRRHSASSASAWTANEWNSPLGSWWHTTLHRTLTSSLKTSGKTFDFSNSCITGSRMSLKMRASPSLNMKDVEINDMTV